MAGAVWTAGHRGAGVKVRDGAYVRGDDFTELGVPDSPFSLTLWVKPLANEKTLVHAAVNTSGGDGWCAPLLGFDSSGNLAAQLHYAPDPKAVVTAVAPAPDLDQWSHLAVTWSPADGLRLYRAGTLAASAPSRFPEERHRFAPAAPVYLFFGTDRGAGCWTKSIESGNFNGAIDEIRVYDFALSSDEVVRDMRGPATAR